MGSAWRSISSRSFFSLDRRQQVKSVVISVGLLSGLAFLVPSAGSAATVGDQAPKTPPSNACAAKPWLGGKQLKDVTANATTKIVSDKNINSDDLKAANTTYYITPGVHYLVDHGQYTQINPGSFSKFIGLNDGNGNGAVIDGQKKFMTAFTAGWVSPRSSMSHDITIQNLEVRNFMPVTTQSAINGDSTANWDIENNFLHDNGHDTTSAKDKRNGGSAMSLGDNMVIKNNCITYNGQYAINGYLNDGFNQTHPLTDGHGPKNVMISNNEIAFNDSNEYDNGPGSPDCGGGGCSAGLKLWATFDTSVVSNYIHDNKNVGVWVDGDNVNTVVSNNLIDKNNDEGIFIEISYNATLQNNTITRNGWVGGPTTGMAVGGIYISEAGGYGAIKDFEGVNHPGPSVLDISGNVLTDNWAGVISWENSNRYCNGVAQPGGQNGMCDLTANHARCMPAAITSPSNLMPCRWSTQNMRVHDNAFNFNPANIPNCSAAHNCGEQGLWSNYANPDSPYLGSSIMNRACSSDPQTIPMIPNSIMFQQNNKFYNNAYKGPFIFRAWDSRVVSLQTWQKAYTFDAAHAPYNCNIPTGYNQDAGSTFDGKTTGTTGTTNTTRTTVTTIPTTVTTVPKYTGRYCRDTGTVQAVQSTSNQPDPGAAEFHFVKVAHASCPNMDYNGPAYILANGSNPDGGMQILPVLAQGEHGKSGPQSLAGELRGAAANGKPVEIQANGTGDWRERKTVSAATAKALAAQLEK